MVFSFIMSFKNMIQKIGTSIMVIAVAFVGYAFLEPTSVGAQVSDTDTIIVNLTIDDGISITSPADVTMSTMGISANSSTGWAVWNVKTNAPGGYTLGVKASASPAMTDGGTNSFADYTETSAGVPDTFAVDAGEFEFGFSAIGVDVENVNSDEYGATGQTTCDVGASSSTVNANLNFEGFTTSDEIIATRTATTTTAGVDTRICFAAGQNGVFTPAGAYTATITATATTL